MLSLICLVFILADQTNAFTIQRLNRVQVINHQGSRVTKLHGREKSYRKCGLVMAKQTNDEFWEAQRKMANIMSETLNNEEKLEKGMSRRKYQNQVVSLVAETFYFSIVLFSIIWLVVPNPFTAISYMLGASLGTAYTYGLGKYVETIGGSAFDQDDVKGSGVGSARFAFLIMLFILVGRFRSDGLQEIPAIFGFFTYQISSLSQGLKDASYDENN